MHVASPAPSLPAAAPAGAGGLLPGWMGTAAFDADGVPLGPVLDVLFDVHTHAPGWLLLALARVRDRYVLAPAERLRHRASGVVLACHHEHVRTAPPSAAPPDGLGREHARRLAAHYRVRCGAGPWEGVVLPRLTAS